MFSERDYDLMIEDLFTRFPSFQQTGSGAYKPGLDRMEFFDSMAGHPHGKFKSVHVAGTNGKGSVSNMLASVLSSSGLKTGLYTSPHILDFRERMRIRDGNTLSYVPKEYVWDYVNKWKDTFGHLEMSFFEITTSMAFSWFADSGVDIAVIETGLGGRLDSTNVIVPELSVITNIGLDHCDMLGYSLGEIAFEKAGIIKPGVPVVVGESNAETDSVFERKVLYSNLSSPEYMGDRNKIMSLLTFADRTIPDGWEMHGDILGRMDLKGEYQEKNLRTALASVQSLRSRLAGLVSFENAIPAIENTAKAMHFHGRWEKISDTPYIICDIGHNAHGLKYNFHQLEEMLSGGEVSSLIMVYGSVADKDYSSVFPLMPENAVYIFTNASGPRAMPAGKLMEKYKEYCIQTGRDFSRVQYRETVEEALRAALSVAESIDGEQETGHPLIYIGGSTFIVAEAGKFFRK